MPVPEDVHNFLLESHPGLADMAIHPREQEVRLLFEHGIRLKGDEGRLEGAGSQTLHPSAQAGRSAWNARQRTGHGTPPGCRCCYVRHLRPAGLQQPHRTGEPLELQLP
jgi:hypothetical protein